MFAFVVDMVQWAYRAAYLDGHGTEASVPEF